MKAGTAQKLALNMISTSIMIQLGRVRGNKMVDMQLSNKKLVDRGKRMLMEELDIDEKLAGQLLEKHKNIRKVLDSYDSQIKKEWVRKLKEQRPSCKTSPFRAIKWLISNLPTKA